MGKTVSIIIIALLLGASIASNVWLYSETTRLDRTVSSQAMTISQVRSDFDECFEANEYLLGEYYRLTDETERLTFENRQYRSAIELYQSSIIQLQQEAEQAQQYDSWDDLLQLIFSLLGT